MTVEKLVYGGQGLARIGGRVALVPFVLPGERIEATLTPSKGGLLSASNVRVVEPSPLRREAACPHFTRCGGCHYQHLGYEGQIEQKREILRETLRRIGKISYDGEISALTAAPWGYRNRIQLHIDSGRVGYFAPASHKLCAVSVCPIAAPLLEQTIAKLEAELPRLGKFDADLELFSNDIDVQVNVEGRLPKPAREFFDTLGATSAIECHGLRVSRGSFFQVNRFLIEPLVETATGGASGRFALDLYSGVGLFSSALRKRFERVMAVEAGASSGRDLEHNSRAAAVPWTSVRAAVEDYLPSMGETPDFILADPPRAGLGVKVTSELLRIAAPRLHLVSCDPSTLARDLAGLLKKYRIAGITIVDLFPQPFHIETVVQMDAV